MIKRDHCINMSQYIFGNISNGTSKNILNSTVLFASLATLSIFEKNLEESERVVGDVNKTVEHIKSVLNTVKRERSSQRSLI